MDSKNFRKGLYKDDNSQFWTKIGGFVHSHAWFKSKLIKHFFNWEAIFTAKNLFIPYFTIEDNALEIIQLVHFTEDVVFGIRYRNGHQKDRPWTVSSQALISGWKRATQPKTTREAKVLSFQLVKSQKKKIWVALS